MATYPAMPLWTDAYLADTTHLSAEEHGAYLLLLMAAWRSRDCTLPDDDKYLARVCRSTERVWLRLKPVMCRFFDIKNGAWTQARIIKERKYLDEVRAKRSAAGHAKHRKDKENADAHAGANALHPHPHPHLEERKIDSVLRPESSSPAVAGDAITAPAKQPPKGAPAEFERFWAAYPRKVGKAAAAQKFDAALRHADIASLLAGVERYMANKPAHQDWCHPATWLHQQRWLDEERVGQGEGAVVHQFERPSGKTDPLIEAINNISKRRAANVATYPGGLGQADDDDQAGRYYLQ